FAVLNPGIDKLTRDSRVDVNARDHQRPEEIAFAAFVDAEVRLEHFRRVHLFIAQFCFAKDFRFQLELDELFYSPALNQNFGSLFINRDRQLVLLSKKDGVRLGGELEAELLEQMP